MTEVSGPSSSGEIARVVQGRIRKDPTERGRSDRLGGTAPPVEGRFRKRSRSRRSKCRVSKGACFFRTTEERIEDWGHALCLVGRLTRQKLSHASGGLRPERDGTARANGSGRRSGRQRREREGAPGQSNTKNNRSRGLVEWA